MNGLAQLDLCYKISKNLYKLGYMLKLAYTKKNYYKILTQNLFNVNNFDVDCFYLYENCIQYYSFFVLN